MRRDLLIHASFKYLRDVWKDTNRSIVVPIGAVVLFKYTLFLYEYSLYES